MKTTCEKPTLMYQLVGQTSSSGKSVIVHQRPAENVAFTTIPRNCGQCTGCRVSRRMALAKRLHDESSFFEESWFVTLTYDDSSLPFAGSLVADHVSAFIKRLRDRIKPNKIRFFSIGEYGSTCSLHEIENCPACGGLQRPHYHLILFGLPLPDRQLTYTRPSKQGMSAAFNAYFGTDSELRYYRSPFLDDVWGKGGVNVTAVSASTMQYVAKYHVEKVTGDKAVDAYSRLIPETGETVPVEVPRSRMSTHPGLGFKWIEKYWRDIYPDGSCVKNGVEFAPPKYYDKWIEKHHPEVWQQTLEKRAERVGTLREWYLLNRKAIAGARKLELQGRSIKKR